MTYKGGIARRLDCLVNLGEGSRSGFDLCSELPGHPDVLYTRTVTESAAQTRSRNAFFHHLPFERQLPVRKCRLSRMVKDRWELIGAGGQCLGVVALVRSAAAYSLLGLKK